MKKTIIKAVLVFGVLFAAVSYSKEVWAGSLVDKTDNLQQDWGCTLRNTSRFDGDSNQCDVSSIIEWNKIDLSKVDVDLLLNSMAEFFACVEDSGSNACAIKYCKCLSRETELRCRIEQRHCIIRSISRS